MVQPDLGFETSTGWTIVPGKGTATYDTVIKRSGLRSGKIYVPSTDPGNSAQFRGDLVSITVGEFITISAWGKIENVTGVGVTSRLRFVETDINGIVLRQTKLEFGSGTVDWAQKSANLVTGLDTAYWYLLVDIQLGSGTLWIDDIIVQVPCSIPICTFEIMTV